MILNFLRVAECPLEYMVSSSYSEYHSQKANARDIIAASKLRSTIDALNQSIKSFYTTELKNYFNQCQQFWNIIHNIQQILINHDKNSHRLLDDLLKFGVITKVFHKGGFTIRIKNEKYAKLIEKKKRFT